MVSFVFVFSEKSTEGDEVSSTSSYETDESTPLLSSTSTDNTSVTIKKKKDEFSLVKPLLKHFLPLLLAVSILVSKIVVIWH